MSFKDEMGKGGGSGDVSLTDWKKKKGLHRGKEGTYYVVAGRGR